MRDTPLVGRRRILAFLACAASAAAMPAAHATAQTGHNPSQSLRLEWTVGKGRRGRPEINGYVLNDYGRSATGVQLLIEHLDAADKATGRTIGYVAGSVPGYGRAYFAIPIPPGAANHRVSILSFDWETGAGA